MPAYSSPKTLDTPVRFIKGVGPSLSKIFSKIGIFTLEDLIYLLPRSFEDRRNATPIDSIRQGSDVLVKGVIQKVVVEQTRRRFSIVKAKVSDGKRSIFAVWFNQPFITRILKKDAKIMVFGKAEINTFSGSLEIFVKDYEIGEVESKQGIVPVYPLTEGIYQKNLRKIIAGAMEAGKSSIEDYLPDRLKQKHDLPDLKEAIFGLHNPQSLNSIKKYRDRLAFDDLFVFQVGLAFRKIENTKKVEGIGYRASGKLIDGFFAKLPFALTNAQQKVMREIESDMQMPHPMNRLVQGDVGCGKTIVSAYAMLVAAQNGYQSAIMAPTEILAMQHYFKLKPLFESLGIKFGLLISSVKNKKEIYAKLATGDIQIVVGTHALIEEKVSFKQLGLVVVDEQHRFGVMQRAGLISKGINPDVLVMTATPIPRTLALTVYGDLDHSIIDALPPGRKPVKTYYIGKSKIRETQAFIRNQIKEGRQAYVVCPLIEESEKVDLKAAEKEADNLKCVFPEFVVALLHGRMPADKKQQIMDAFKDRKIDVLVSTTVIEVGIDVPNASIMLIEQAERFGLAQLHQLRGRIGRGQDQAFCFLMGQPKTEDSRKRIKAMLDSTDGFYIAEADLQIRGPGDLYGTAQAGLPEFRIADIIRDEKILEISRKEAFSLIEQDSALKHADHQRLKEKLLKRFGRFLKLGALN